MEGYAIKAVTPLIKFFANIIQEKMKDGDVTKQRICKQAMQFAGYENAILDKLDKQNAVDLESSKDLFEEAVHQLEDIDGEKRILVGLLQNHHRLRFNKVSKRHKNNTGKRKDEVDGVRKSDSSIQKAKKKFENCSSYALNAFNNRGLKLAHRLSAAKLRIMAIILEDVQKAPEQLKTCTTFLKKVNADDEVKSNVQVQVDDKNPMLQKVRQCFDRKEREKVIQLVTSINRLVWNYTHRGRSERPDGNYDTILSEWPLYHLRNGKIIHPVIDGVIRNTFLKSWSDEERNDLSEHTFDESLVEFLQGYTCAVEADGFIFASSSRENREQTPRQASVTIFKKSGKQCETFGGDVFKNESILTSMAVNVHGQVLIVDDHTNLLHAFSQDGAHIGRRASWEEHDGYSYIATAPPNRVFKTHGRVLRIYDLNEANNFREYNIAMKAEGDVECGKVNLELNGIGYDYSREKLYVLVKITKVKKGESKSLLKIYKVNTSDDININFESDIKLPPAYCNSKGIGVTSTGLVAVGDNKNEVIIV